MLTEPRLRELLARFSGRHVGVFGDFFLDKYLDFDPELAEVSLETGKTAHQVVNVRHSPGAAGTVVSNLRALGAGEVIPIGFTGADGEGYELRQDLSALGCPTDHLLCLADRRTPTYLKPQNARVPGVAGEAERYDTKNRTPLAEAVQDQLLDSLRARLPGLDALIVADQVEEENCGVVTAGTRRALATLAKEFPSVVIWADSRRRIGLFEGIIIKPNQGEAVQAAFPAHTGPLGDDLVRAAGSFLAARTGLPVFLTRSERGLLVFAGDACTEVPAVRTEGPIDPTGAGDSATAAAVLALASGGTPVEAAVFANLVASLTIEQLGITGTARPEQLPPRLARWQEQQKGGHRAAQPGS